VVIVEDLEAARKLEHHLRRLDRLADLGTLAAGMAHEIKNALVAGKTFIELLLEKNREAELAGVVKREIGRIDAIVSRMLKYAGDREREFKPLRVHELLEHSLRLVEPQLNGKAIRLERSFLAAADLVEGNENELQQAVVNLVLNSLEAMSPGGTLAISTSPGEDAEPVRPGAPASASRIQILIRDTGPGIAPDNLPRVFAPFFTTKPEGTGLGLAITQRIVLEHAGTIRVESEVNRGTQFCIILPLAESAGAAQ
jgi:signal transduction histidine kinase